MTHNSHDFVLIGLRNLYIRFSSKESKKHMYANHNMIGYLAIYSHIPISNIVINIRKKRFLQKILIITN